MDMYFQKEQSLPETIRLDTIQVKDCDSAQVMTLQLDSIKALRFIYPDVFVSILDICCV